MIFDLYDFDGTIYDGDSSVDIILFAMKKYPRIIPGIIINGIKYLLKFYNKEEFKSKYFSFVKYIDDIDKFVEEFWNKNEYKLKPFWTENKKHDNDIIISASGYFWLKPIADKYKVYDLIATNINPKTGMVIDKNCHGKEKVKLFYSKYPGSIINKMYTDSMNDLPLLKEAKVGILVKKNKLIPYANH